MSLSWVELRTVCYSNSLHIHVFGPAIIEATVLLALRCLSVNSEFHWANGGLKSLFNHWCSVAGSATGSSNILAVILNEAVSAMDALDMASSHPLDAGKHFSSQTLWKVSQMFPIQHRLFSSGHLRYTLADQTKSKIGLWSKVFWRQWQSNTHTCFVLTLLRLWSGRQILLVTPIQSSCVTLYSSQTRDFRAAVNCNPMFAVQALTHKEKQCIHHFTHWWRRLPCKAPPAHQDQ